MAESEQTPIKVLLLDIGGVFLTNGWDTRARKEAAKHYGLSFDELDGRHRIVFDAYEAGKITLDDYLDLVLFYEDRSFSKADVKLFMMEQSQPYPEMIDLIKKVKKKYHLLSIAVNNEGKELNEYRIRQFGLKDIIDVFASSCYVHVRKPDKDLYQLALDLSQALPEEALYIDDRSVFVQAAERYGILGLQHISVEETQTRLAELGLRV